MHLSYLRPRKQAAKAADSQEAISTPLKKIKLEETEVIKEQEVLASNSMDEMGQNTSKTEVSEMNTASIKKIKSEEATEVVEPEENKPVPQTIPVSKEDTDFSTDKDCSNFIPNEKENTDINISDGLPFPWSSSVETATIILESENITDKVRETGKDRKERQRRYENQLLQPRSAVSTLKSMFTGIRIEVECDSDGIFTARTVFRDQSYSASGDSEEQASEDCAEIILRDLVEKACREAKPKLTGVVKNDVDVYVEAMDEQELSLRFLASFAVHKLWLKLESEGVDFNDTIRNNDVPEEGKPPVVKKKTMAKPQLKPLLPSSTLPKNADKMHPVSLLTYMCPDLFWTYLGAEGPHHGLVHTESVTVNGVPYIGTGRSKREARTQAASFACEALKELWMTKKNQMD